MPGSSSSSANAPALSRRAIGWWPMILLAGLFLVRLGFASLVEARPNLAIANDTDRYVPIANAILAGTALAPNPARTGLLLNTVGYPLFLAAVFLVRGHMPGDIALAQLIITGALGIVLYWGLVPIVGRKPALFAAALYLIDPLTILWSMTVLTETLLAVVLGIGAVAITVWASSRKTWTLLLAGIFCSLACLVKPYAALVVGAWAVGLLFLPRVEGEVPQRRLVQGIRRALIFVIPTITLALPWVIRNDLIWGCPALSSVDRVTMRDYVAAKVVSESEHLPLDQVQNQLQQADPGVCPKRTADYFRIVVSHPWIFAKLQVAGTIPVLIGTNFDRWLRYFGTDYSLPDLWGPFVDGGPGQLLSVLEVEWARFPPGIMLMILLTVWQLVLYALGVFGLLASRTTYPSDIRWSSAILAVAILILVMSPGQGGNERFRVAVQPLLMILVAFGMRGSFLYSTRDLKSRSESPSGSG